MKKQFKLLTSILVLGLLFFSSCQTDPHTYAEIETEFGKMKMMLFNSTPEHRDNFIKLVNEGFYEDLLFHRVMKGFMAQGGDPQSKGSNPTARLGGGGPGYTIPAEIGAPHFRGSVAAARTPTASNPEMRSSGSQFFIVEGAPQSIATIEQIEGVKGIKYNDVQKEMYQTRGGYPSLDNEYSVFGEIVEGLEVLDKIMAVQTDGNPPVGNSRPKKDIWMKIKILE